jgi:threonine dehydrogenase-like Zn-dependent dehydrogenase
LPETFAKVIRMFEQGIIDPRPLITHRLRFDEIVDRLRVVVREPGLIKAMIGFES